MVELQRRISRALVDAVVLAVAVVVGWYLVVPLAHVLLGAQNADAEIGGMWAVVATAFVFSDQLRASDHSFTGRMVATVISSALCFLYLVVLPFSIWGLALVVSIGVIVLALLGLQAETVTTSITTAVVLVVGGLDGAGNGWEDPIIRILATTIGGLVGLAAAWSTSKLRRSRGTAASP